MQDKKTDEATQIIMYLMAFVAGYAFSFLPTFGLFFLFGSFETAKELTWFTAALPALGLAMLSTFLLEEAERDSQEISRATTEIKQKYDFTSTHQFKFNRSSLEIDESQRLILIQSKKDLSIVKFSELMDVELSIDDISITSLKTNSGLGGAVAGGLLFGGVGAIAGAITSRKTTSDTNQYIEKISLKISIMSFSKPFQEIVLLKFRSSRNSKDVESALKVAHDWVSVLSNCIEIAKKDNKDLTVTN